MQEAVSGYVPEFDPSYVPTDFYKNVREIVLSNRFFPTLITGETGIAKTTTAEQVCASLSRNLFRVNITEESDEDALMGGFRLKDGDTVYHRGPVLEAMETGSVLLLDELDSAHPRKIMCLQSVLEGKGYYAKRINSWVHPKDGFTIIATANTKGLGDTVGRYIGTQILNEAMLDRFKVTFEAKYPSLDQEKEILSRHCAKIGLEPDWAGLDILLNLAKSIREGVEVSQDISYNLSTRRLTDIVSTYQMFGSWDTAIQLCIARFDKHHQDAFMNIYRTLLPFDEQKAEVEMDYSKVKPFFD